MIEQKIDSGIESATTSVFRQVPRKSRIIAAVRAAARTPSRITPLSAARTKTDWSNCGLSSSSGGQRRWIRGSVALMPLITSRVEAPPLFSIGTKRAARAVLAHDVGLRRVAVAHLRHVADVHGRAVDRFDREVAKPATVSGLLLSEHAVFAIADLRRAGGQSEILGD